MDDDIASVAALSEPVRRDLYRYVVSQDGPVSREQAAAGVGVAHHVAKFNLDRLVADGLLDVEYSRPPGRSGPGAGRPAKLYRRTERDISVTLPERHYDLAGQVMAEAITVAARDAVPVGEALHTAARTAGSRLASTPGSVGEILARCGYEPRVTSDGITLTNCPFHSLAEQYTDLVCGMNLDLIDGLLESLGSREFSARLDPAPGRCCVSLSAGRAGTR